jgi:heptosyltransferase-2
MNSLLIAPQWIGDAVMSEPLVRTLAARGERIGVVALPWVAPIYRSMAGVSEVIEAPFRHGGMQWQARRAMARALRDRFDVAYVLPNSLKSALLPWLAGVPKRVGHLGEMRWGLLTHRFPNPPRDARPPMVPFYLELAGEVQAPNARPELQWQGDSDGLLQAHGLRPGAYGVFAPGAEFGPAKRWPARHFASLATQLRQKVVLLGSPKEAEDAAAIEANVEPGTSQMLNLIGKTHLSEALGLIARAAWVVSNDSGLMHVAAAFGVPQVAVFGSSSPLHTPPLNERARVVWLKQAPDVQPALDCAPCFQRTCPLGHLRCLNEVQPERVAQALASVLPAGSLAGQA